VLVRCVELPTSLLSKPGNPMSADEVVAREKSERELNTVLDLIPKAAVDTVMIVQLESRRRNLSGSYQCGAPATHARSQVAHSIANNSGLFTALQDDSHAMRLTARALGTLC
jgi:hypothetical protein